MSTMTNIQPSEIPAKNGPVESSATGVAWSAILGGAFAAASLSLILLFLGSALGFSSVSPWSAANADTISSFTIKTAIWLIIMQWFASGFGGYLTGRLRTKWTGMHTEEVFFRDTAHGFLAWAVATVLTAGLLASTAASIVSGGVHAGTFVAAGAAAGAVNQAGPHPDAGLTDPTRYSIDAMFRPNIPAAPATAPNATTGIAGSTGAAPVQAVSATTPEDRMEATRILMTGIKNATVPDGDKAYLAQVVSAHTGLSQADAAKRVDDTIADLNSAKEKAKEAAETARKAMMKVSLYMFFSMLIGAFIASSSAALGGIHRDEY